MVIFITCICSKYVTFVVTFFTNVVGLFTFVVDFYICDHIL